MKIYSSKSPFNIDNYMGKDIWVEAINDEDFYYYFRFLYIDDGVIICNQIYADIIDEFDVGCLLDEFPRIPPDKITTAICTDKFFNTEFSYNLADIKIEEPLEVRSSAEIVDGIQQCLAKL